MRCASCYAENPAWATVCSACGGPTRPLEFCPNGHLLPAALRECPVCPTLWPAVAPFSGPAILRGLLWVERGRLRVLAGAEGAGLERVPVPGKGPESQKAPGAEKTGGELAPGASPLPATAEYIELRDRALPLSFQEESDGARLLADEDPSATCKVLVRPAGITVCQKGSAGPRKGVLAYEPIGPGAAIALGGVSLRLYTVDVPAGAVADTQM